MSRLNTNSKSVSRRPASGRKVGWAWHWSGTVAGLLRVLLVGWAALVPGASSSSAAEKAVITEHELKAAIVPKLPLFMAWPESAFADAGSPVRIGVLGPNPFGSHLTDALRGKKVGRREMVLEACPSAEAAAQCHLVFISSRNLAEAREVLTALNRSSVVTVCDLPGFNQVGGMITLVAENKRIGLVINPAALREAGIRPDPQLLRIARIEEGSASPKP